MARPRKPKPTDPNVKPVGRPQRDWPNYWPDWADGCIAWMFEGKSLLSFCEREGGPSRQSVYELRDLNPTFGRQFAQARSAGADVLVDLAQQVADDGRNDWMEEVNAKTGEVGYKLNHEHVQRSKLRVETLLKRAACYQPAQYGLKVQMGGDPNNPTPIKVETGPPAPPLPDLLAGLERLAELGREVLGAQQPDDGTDDES